MFNQCTFVGNLTKDPDIRFTTTSKAVAEFSIAVSEGKKDDDKQITLFLNCTAWENSAAICEKYLSKGKRVLVTGKLREQRYEKADGSLGRKTFLLVHSIVLLTPKGDGEQVKATEGDAPPQVEEIPEVDIESL